MREQRFAGEAQKRLVGAAEAGPAAAGEDEGGLQSQYAGSRRQTA